jgi:hypothetical protein
MPAEKVGELFEKSIAIRRKKRRGVYFTPKKYGEMMSAAVLNERLDHAAYADLLRIKVLDPACGGGAFLIAAYRTLLESAQRVLGGPLSAEQKLQVARSCIFGADVDRRALAVAAHSLSLVAHEPRLASLLERNLVHGNALIDDIFPGDGFDAVLVNPPYVFGEQLSQNEKPLLRSRYRSSGRQIDLYAAFLELAATRLCRSGGAYAFIVPDAILAREQRIDVRNILLQHAPPHTIAHVGAAFTKNGAGVSAAILIGRRGEPVDQIRVIGESANGAWETVNTLPMERVRDDARNRFLIHVRPEEWQVLEALRDVPRLGSAIVRISRGEEIGKRSLATAPSHEFCVPAIAGEAVTPYVPAATRYFLRSLLKDYGCYAAPKILVRKTDDRLIACAEYEGTATLQSVYNLQVRPEKFDCILAVLNSRFARWFLKRTVTQYKLLMPQITQRELLSIPIPDSSRYYGALLNNAAADNGAREALESAVLEDLGLGSYQGVLAP